MKLEQWFSTPIWFDDLTCDFEKVKQGCLKLKQQSAGRELSNIGGWQSNDIELSDYEEFRELDVEMREYISKVCEQIDPNFKVKVTNVWVNVSRPQDYNSGHFHTNSTLSGVIYVDVDDNSGPILFRAPNLIIHYPITTSSKLFFRTVTYKPKIGRMLVFPAWIEHEVRPSPRSNIDRISISFNLIQVDPVPE